MSAEVHQVILSLLVGLPLCVAVILGWTGSWRTKISENIISGVTASALWLCFVIACILAFDFKPTGDVEGFFSYDAIAAVFTVVTAFVTGLTASFAKRYLHSDSGYLRFHCFLLMLAGGSFLTFSTNENLALIAGWECVGISSFLLIAYFYRRTRPRDHSILVFACYRFGDAALMAACAMAPIATGVIGVGWSSPFAVLIILMIVIAAACKSAQGPFSFWLPRAMEGPTPSSAVFYGGVSVHLGCFLLLRTESIWGQENWARIVIILVGLTSAIHGWISGRTCSDVKSKLAHATISHIGIVFIEIGFGWTTLALIHIAAHALVRTPQLLLASSALAEFLQERRTGFNVLRLNGWESKLPASLGWRLYGYGLSRGNLENTVKYFVVKPFEFCVELCGSTESWLERKIPESINAMEKIEGDSL